MDNYGHLRGGDARTPGDGGGHTGLIVSVVLVAGAVAAAILVAIFAGSAHSSANPAPGSTQWVGVFLSDSEVFFGHVKAETDSEIDLTNVFYLKTSQGSSTSTNSQTGNNGLAVLGLVANQLQCPTDEIHIKLKSVLNIQILQSASYVAKNLDVVSKQSQSCFQPSQTSATPAPTASASAAPTATPTPAPTPTQAPTVTPAATSTPTPA